LDETPVEIKKEKKEKKVKAKKPSPSSNYDKFPREFLTEFIKIYKSHECLWKPKSPNYYNRKVKRAAWQELIEKYREVHPNPTKMVIRRKIGTLRTSFRREYLRVQRAQDTWLPHKPKLWYYDQVSFIAVDPSIGNADDDDMEDDNDGDDKEDYSCNGDEDQHNSSEDDRNDNDECTKDSSHLDDSQDPLLVEMNKKSGKTKNKVSTAVVIAPPPENPTIDEPKRDDHDLFGQTIASKIRKMSGNQQIMAEKLIFDVLCYGRLERLDMGTSIQNLKKL
jgi:Alcohol dehydrogenase transcription factor Myb/SANT-like